MSCAGQAPWYTSAMLPRSIGYLDTDGFQRRAPLKESKRPSGYIPSAEYHPTNVMGKCSRCTTVSIIEFEGGFDLKKGDRIMDGKPVIGYCYRCRRDTELVPVVIKNPEESAHIRHMYSIQQALDEAARRGESVGSSGVLWPLARVKLYERYRQSVG